MIPGILGKKIGMTQIFEEDGARIPVTVLGAGPCFVQAVKAAGKDGYNAVQIGYDDAKEKRIKKPQREWLKANDLKPRKFVHEIRCAEEPDVKVGDEWTNKIFQKGDMLDITGVSKGKGFQGGMKRCGWKGGGESHGSMCHRAPGSIGASAYPSRVMKGHGMPGHMGSRQTTVQNLEVIDIDAENNTISVRGAVPGSNGTYLVIRYALKKPVAPREEKEEVEVKEKPETKEDKQPELKEQPQVEAQSKTEEQAEDKSQGKEGSKE